MKYEVVKKQLGSRGEWFSYKARRFATEVQAVTYAEHFAQEQAGISGTRIVVRERKGQRIIKDIRVG